MGISIVDVINNITHLEALNRLIKKMIGLK